MAATRCSRSAGVRPRQRSREEDELGGPCTRGRQNLLLKPAHSDRSKLFCFSSCLLSNSLTSSIAVGAEASTVAM